MNLNRPDEYDEDGVLDSFTVEYTEEMGDGTMWRESLRITLTGSEKENLKKGQLTEEEKYQLLPDYAKEAIDRQKK